MSPSGHPAEAPDAGPHPPAAAHPVGGGANEFPRRRRQRPGSTKRPRRRRPGSTSRPRQRRLGSTKRPRRWRPGSTKRPRRRSTKRPRRSQNRRPLAGSERPPMEAPGRSPPRTGERAGRRTGRTSPGAAPRQTGMRSWRGSLPRTIAHARLAAFVGRWAPKPPGSADAHPARGEPAVNTFEQDGAYDAVGRPERKFQGALRTTGPHCLLPL